MKSILLLFSFVSEGDGLGISKIYELTHFKAKITQIFLFSHQNSIEVNESVRICKINYIEGLASEFNIE